MKSKSRWCPNCHESAPREPGESWYLHDEPAECIRVLRDRIEALRARVDEMRWDNPEEEG